jgi:hypothetical protein
MAHNVHWLKENRVLYVNYKDHQTVETLTACLDEMATHLDQAGRPVIVLINWQEVTGMDFKALLTVRGHRAFSHPMAARGILVGMDGRTQMENEISSVSTRQSKNTQYFTNMDEAMSYLENMLAD